MELQKNSLAIKLYNSSIWLRNRLFNFKVSLEDHLLPRRWYDTDEEYAEATARAEVRAREESGFLSESSDIDLCTLVRQYLWGALIVLLYAAFYGAMFYTIIWYNIASFGIGYALIGFGWLFLVLLSIAGLLGIFVGIVYASTEYEVVEKIKDSVQNTVRKSSILHVIVERWKSFKDKTCVIIRVKGE